MIDKQPHLSVLYHDIIRALQPTSAGRYIDATLGAGGHAAGILEASAPDGSLLGLDVDPQALALARQRLQPFGERAILVQASYITLGEQMAAQGWPSVEGIVLDLGVSSMQLDTAERGFSFLSDGPLDMRFSPQQSQTAADLINHLDEFDLADLIWRYGEEPKSRQIAAAICRARPLSTTHQLAEVIYGAVNRGGAKKGSHRSHLHPATLTFQALRIATNQELQSIETVLPQAVEALAIGGRLAIISFHSLEDRMVKQYFRRESRDCICPPRQPVCTCGHRATVSEINRHAVVATEEEIQLNPRARSARMRCVEKLKMA